MELLVCPTCGSQSTSVDGVCHKCGNPIVVQPWWERTSSNSGDVPQEIITIADGPLVRFGRRLAIISYSLLIVIPFICEMGIIIQQGSPELLGTSWFMLNVLLCCLTFRGRRWSRYVGGGINGFLGFSLLAAFLKIAADVIQSDESATSDLISLSVGFLLTAGLAVPSAILLFSTSVDLFILSRTKI